MEFELLKDYRDFGDVFMDGTGLVLQSVIDAFAAVVAMFLDFIHRGFGSGKEDFEVVEGLCQGIGGTDPLLNPESDDSQQEQDEEPRNGKEQFDEV
jgi:hypothetical protein